MSVDSAIEEKLYVENQYGYKHAGPNPKPLTSNEKDYLKRFGYKATFEYEPGVEVPLHPMCVNCQARHILKYKNHPNVKDGKPFQIKCKGVPGQLPPGVSDVVKKYVTEKNIDEDRAKLLVKASVDPVAWAELMFGFSDKTPGWTLRWYQKEQLRCTAARMVLREGRRSGKTFIMALKLLFHAFNDLIEKGTDGEGKIIKQGPNIIAVTPFQAQLTNLFDELEGLIKRNPDLASKVTTKHAGSLYVKTPFFRMEFNNGATISGFVTGVEIRQDGSAAGSIRGQNAQIMYVDEMDMIPPDVIDKVIIPILFTPNCRGFYVTSTPIGKAGKFFDLCKNRPDFKEDYLPTTVLPHWDEVKSELDYSDPTDDAFITEYMANFIESATGVFKSMYVYNAMYNYNYEDAEPGSAWWNSYAKVRARSDLITCIGIDWNKNAGSEFVVVRYDPAANIWWVAEAVNVSANKFNSVVFKEQVIALNFKWKPDYIYADEGYGHHIIDDLLWEAHRITVHGSKTILDQETAKIGQRLKKFNFSQKVELTDPVRGNLFTRTGKEFLVENAVRVFESERLRFPQNDNTLKSQLLNYVVLRRHITNNRPVYGMRTEKLGDHRLDALMLALGGLFLEKHPLYSPLARRSLGAPGLLTKEELERRSGDGDEIDQILAKGIPGVGIEVTKFIRGNTPEDDKLVRAVYAAEQQQQQTPYTRHGERRGDFPIAGNNKSKSVFDELWERADSTAGYDTDTRALHVGRKRQTERQRKKSDLFVTRRKNKSPRSSF